MRMLKHSESAEKSAGIFLRKNFMEMQESAHNLVRKKSEGMKPSNDCKRGDFR